MDLSDSVAKIFEQRLEREGRLPEYRKLLKELMASGLGYTPARWRAIRASGYPGPKEERRIHEEWLKMQEAAQFKDVALKVRQVDVEELRIERFDDAIDELPANASPSDEIAWVRAHPAMGRKDRMKDKTKDVEIKADDVLYAPHGRAPSRAAVNQLIFWANRPAKFFEGLLSEHKKTMDEGRDVAERKADVGLNEIKDYLASLEEEDACDGSQG